MRRGKSIIDRDCIGNRSEFNRIERDLVGNLTRFRELFRGRFTREELQRALENHNWNQDETIAFIFENDASTVRQLIHTREEACISEKGEGGGNYIQNIQSDLDLARNAKERRIPTQRRQFACVDCDNAWWQTVPARKMVSKCHRCHRKYKALPREDEWGWGEFSCPSCGNHFNGFAHMNRTQSSCYQCGTLVYPMSVRPPERRSGQRRSENTHSCTGCRGRGRGGGGGGRGGGGMCVHPQTPRARQVLVGSGLHVSSGSTVDSILSDDVSSVSGRSSRPPSEPSIPEDDEDGQNGH
ncbi:hypothetical protein FSP39_010236 [Pinctada imbricata]|uniref:Uncharacterized protein n=1 Tax=Pinctada imbricata TaxID=66713 RepID=A0AA89C329_PINIB|nr:hypothetical protein FSP39_010236 [Pinctada imbricata]